ncbi:MAG: hypothetical protein QXE06_05420 [Candidatus Bathyarchaeia archaeon]
MILGFPDEIFFILVYAGVATTLAVIFGVLLYLLPPTGKLLLKYVLSRKKGAINLEMRKTSLVSALVKSFGPGWIETSEGKRYVAPVIPKGAGSGWDPARDVLGKLCLLDGTVPCYITDETSILAGNPEILTCLEAYVKGYSDETQIPVAAGSNPHEMKVSIPVSPRGMAEAVRALLSTENIEQFEERVIEAEVKRRMKSEWGPIIKIALILGMIFIAGLIVLLIAKGALGV